MSESTDPYAGYRGHRGRFGPGNPGGPGAPPRSGAELVELLAEKKPGLVEKLVEVAMDGDVTALRTCLTYLDAPAKLSREKVDPLPEHVAMMPPHLRVRAISQLVASGTLPPSHAEVLTTLCERELSLGLLEPMKAMLLSLKMGEAAEPEQVDAMLSMLGGDPDSTQSLPAFLE